MTAKESILSKLAEARDIDVALPEVPDFGWPGDPVDNFKERLAGFDGKCFEFDTRESALEWLATHVDAQGNTYSSLKDFPARFCADDFKDPHLAHIIESTVVGSQLGIGESGSVLLRDEDLGVPAAALLCRDLYVLLNRNNIVGGIHEAYNKTDLRRNHYSSFFSGPSATADIEAVHITGAQGEISLTVLLYG